MNTPAHLSSLDELGLDLAPHAVVRAARWSVDGLLALPRSSRAQAGDAQFDHAQRLQDELQRLWLHTLGSESFRKALAVSHPALYDRLRTARCPRTWNKAARQLTATLYRQWARACWRTEPSGLWSGVGLTSLRSARPEKDGLSTVGRVAVAPHLQPFAMLLLELARTSPYVQRGRFKVHPSAWRESAGVWLVRVSLGEGSAGVAPDRTRRLRLRHIDPDAADRCIAALVAQGPLPYGALLRVATRCLSSESTAKALVDQLMSAQLLIGGLALPAVFETAWQALERAATDLLPAHRSAWHSAVDDLRVQCLHLEQHHQALSADEIWQATQVAAARIETLASQWGVASLRLPRSCLHWDAGLPAAMPCEPAILRRAQHALALYEQYHRLADPVVALDALYARAQDEGQQLALRRTLAAHGDWQSLAAALRAQGQDGGLSARLRAQGRVCASVAAQSAVATAPLGALMLRMGRRRTTVSGLSHEPWLAYARFGALLGRHAPHGHPLHAWCDSALTAFSQTTNVALAQLRVACVPLANLLAQPRFSVARPLDLYGTTPGALPDAGLQLCHDGERRWLQSPSTPRPVVALCASALDLGQRDPLVERVLLTGWRVRPPVSADVLNDGQPEGQPHKLASDVVRRRARWTLSGEAALALAHAEPAERWRRWQAWARHCQWPELLTVSCDGEPAVLMPRDSALAVEVMFRAPGSDAPRFEIEAPEDEFLITDAQGHRYATELILAFSRDQHAWSHRGQPLVAVPVESGATEADACA